MAHYAYIDSDSIVVTVIVGKHEDELINGLDTETYYALGTQYTVKRTSFNARIRKNCAGIGYSYDAGRDAFIAPQPFASWLLVETTCRWAAPVTMPAEGGPWQWDEATLSWITV